MLSLLAYRGLHATALPALARRYRNAGVILGYHNVISSADTRQMGSNGLHMSVERFGRQMRWLVAHYDVLPLSEFLDRLIAGRPMRQTASLSFDDAYAGVFEHACPVLRELGITATVFIIPGAPAGKQRFWWDHPATQRAGSPNHQREWFTPLRGDGAAILQSLQGEPHPDGGTPAACLPASWHVVGAAARSGMELGIHSATHRALPTLTDEELFAEIEGSREALAREVGTKPDVFAFPYGLWDERVRRRVEQAGYRAALTVDYGLVSPGVDRWALPRVTVPSDISDPAYKAWVAGLSLRWALGK